MGERNELVLLPSPAKPKRKNPHTFNLRMPAELETRLKAAAVENCRSLNEEIVYRLMRSLDGWRQG